MEEIIPFIAEKISAEFPATNNMKAGDFKALLELTIEGFGVPSKDYLKVLRTLKKSYQEYFQFCGTAGHVRLIKPYYQKLPAPPIEEEKEEEAVVIVEEGDNFPVSWKIMTTLIERLKKINSSNNQPGCTFKHGELGISEDILKKVVSALELDGHCYVHKYDNNKSRLTNWRQFLKAAASWVSKNQPKRTTPPTPTTTAVVVEEVKPRIPKREELFKRIEAYFEGLPDLDEPRSLQDFEGKVGVKPELAVQLYSLGGEIKVRWQQFVCGNRRAYELFCKREVILVNRGRKPEPVVTTPPVKEVTTTAASNFEKYLLEVYFKNQHFPKVESIKVIDFDKSTQILTYEITTSVLATEFVNPKMIRRLEPILENGINVKYISSSEKGIRFSYQGRRQLTATEAFFYNHK